MSEGGLQYLLGGIGKLGGKVTGKTAQMVTRNINNAAFRVAADLGIKMFGEGVEEYFQEILDPVFRNLALGENNEIKLISEEGAYSFLLGAITAGLLEGPGSIKSTVNAAQLGNAIIKGGKVDALVANALTLAHNTEAYQLARQITGGELNQNSGNLGELLASYSEEGGDISFLTELPVEKGRLAATREKVQAKFEAEFEAAKERAGLLRDILGARLDLQTARTAMRTYNEAAKSRQAEGQTATAQMRSMLRTAGNQKAQMNAELNVAKTEAILRLRPLHTAMQRAMQTGDFAAFLQMKDRYQQGYALEQAKHRAARADIQSRAVAIDTGIKSALAAMQERFGPVEGGELENAGAQGYVNTVGEATGTEAQGQVAASVDGGDGGILNQEGNGSQQQVGETEKLKLVPPTRELKEKFDSEGLTQDKIDSIVSLPKSQKPKPETYLSSKYIEEHKQSFKHYGAVKIMRTEPSGTIGGKGGTFVMSGDQLESIIKSCKGDISKIEDALGFDRGYLGKNPVIVEIHEVSGLRLPQGNEIGALPEYWLPGGYTVGGIKEAVIDPAPVGTYVYRYLF